MLQTVSTSIANFVGFDACGKRDDVKEDVFASTRSYTFHCLPLFPAQLLNLVTYNQVCDTVSCVAHFIFTNSFRTDALNRI